MLDVVRVHFFSSIYVPGATALSLTAGRAGDGLKHGTVLVTTDSGARCAAICAANKLIGRQTGDVQPRNGAPRNLSIDTARGIWQLWAGGRDVVENTIQSLPPV